MMYWALFHRRRSIAAFPAVPASLECQALEPRRLLAASTPLDWQPAADAPSARTEGARAVVNGKLYTVGGFLGTSLAVTKELDVYDPATDTWSRLADMPVPQTHAATAVDGSDFWIAGFFLNNGVSASDLVYKYDTLTDTWTKEPSLPGARGAAGMAILDRSLHVWGGLSGQTTSAADHWALNLDDPSQGWTALAPLPQPLDHMGSVALNGKLWSIGGFIDKREADGNQPVVYRYDPASDQWATDIAQLPVGLGHIGPDTTVAGDKIIIAGGQVNASFEDMITTVHQYDSTTDQWTTLEPLPEARKSAFVGFADGKLIISSGNQETSPFESSKTWVTAFDPDDDGGGEPAPTPVTPIDALGPDLTGLVLGRFLARLIAGARSAAVIVVRNNGPGIILGNMQIALSASTTPDDPSTAVALRTVTLPVGLIKGRARGFVLPFVLPAGLSSGSYRLLATFDAANAFVESNESNNTITGPAMQVEAQLRNVQAATFFSRPAFRAGGIGAIGFFLKNTGNLFTAGTFSITLTARSLSLQPGGHGAAPITVLTITRRGVLLPGRRAPIILLFRVDRTLNGTFEFAATFHPINMSDADATDNIALGQVTVI